MYGIRHDEAKGGCLGEVERLKGYDEQPEIARTPVLMYHEVYGERQGREDARKTNPVYRLTADRFREQLDCLQEHGHSTVTLNPLLRKDSALDSAAVAITFDDGWGNNYTNAFPMLRRRDMTATILRSFYLTAHLQSKLQITLMTIVFPK